MKASLDGLRGTHPSGGPAEALVSLEMSFEECCEALRTGALPESCMDALMVVLLDIPSSSAWSREGE